MALRDFLAKLTGRSAPPARAAPETRASSDFGPSFGGDYYSPSGGSPTYAENLSAVLACVSTISAAIASLPPLIYRREGERRVETTDHWLADLIACPNHLQTWPDFAEWAVAQFLLNGNCVADPQINGRGEVTSLSPVPWGQCQPILIPASVNEGLGPQAPSARLAFDTMRLVAPWAGTGVPKRIFADDCLFLRDRSDTGILGRSRLSRCPMVLDSAMGAQAFSASMWANQGVPNIALEHPGQLSAEASQRIAQSFKDTHVGPGNARKPVVLEEGLKANPLNLSAEDNELLESRRFSVEEIARIFDVPPPMVGDWRSATFSNTTTAFQWFGTKTLLPIVRKIEAEFQRSIIGHDRVSLQLDLSGLLRGDFTTRTTASVALVRAGILTPNEAREIEGFPPMEGGEALLPMSMGGAPGGQGEDAPDPTTPAIPPGQLNGHANGSNA